MMQIRFHEVSVSSFWIIWTLESAQSCRTGRSLSLPKASSQMTLWISNSEVVAHPDDEVAALRMIEGEGPDMGALSTMPCSILQLN